MSEIDRAERDILRTLVYWTPLGLGVWLALGWSLLRMAASR